MFVDEHRRGGGEGPRGCDLGLYKLVGKRPVRVQSMRAFSRWFTRRKRNIALTHIGPAAWVSTVFLGIDSALFIRGPILFETMVFAGNWDGEMQWRSRTWGGAICAHHHAVKRARGLTRMPSQALKQKQRRREHKQNMQRSRREQGL